MKKSVIEERERERGRDGGVWIYTCTKLFTMQNSPNALWHVAEYFSMATFNLRLVPATSAPTLFLSCTIPSLCPSVPPSAPALYAHEQKILAFSSKEYTVKRAGGRAGVDVDCDCDCGGGGDCCGGTIARLVLDK